MEFLHLVNISIPPLPIYSKYQDFSSISLHKLNGIMKVFIAFKYFKKLIYRKIEKSLQFAISLRFNTFSVLTDRISKKNPLSHPYILTLTHTQNFKDPSLQSVTV